jgi:hypothetical protein
MRIHTEIQRGIRVSDELVRSNSICSAKHNGYAVSARDSVPAVYKVIPFAIFGILAIVMTILCRWSGP